MKITISVLEKWAKENPDKLISYLSDPLAENWALTFAAEIAGKSLASNEVIEPLLNLLNHISPLVREGTIYGLYNHINVKGVIEKVKELSEKDTSAGVREAALELLSGT